MFQAVKNSPPFATPRDVLALANCENRVKGVLLSISPATITGISVATDTTLAGCATHAATEPGLKSWSRVVNEDLRSRGIRVAGSAPGATGSDVWPAGTTLKRLRMSRAGDTASAIRVMFEVPTGTSIDRLDVAPAGGAF